MQDKHKPKKCVVSNLSIPLCILTLLWLGCSLVSPAGYGEEVYAEEADDAMSGRVANGNITVNSYKEAESTITIALKPTTMVTLTPTDEAGQPAKFNVVATINVQNSSGYTVYVGSESENLIGQSTGVEIPSITNTTSFDNIEINHWGFSYQEGNTIASNATYIPIPIGTTGKEVLSNRTNPKIENETREVVLSYGTRLNSHIRSDLYQNKVTLSVISDPMKVASFDGITTMQALTPTICKEADINETAYLEDIRDRNNGVVGSGTHYWVTKLKDGNCWMSQNLDLNLDQTKPLKTDEGSASNYTPVISTFGPSIDDRYSSTYANDAKAYHSWDEGKYVVIYPSQAQNKWFGFTQEQGGIAGFADHDKVLALGYNGLQNTEYGVVADASQGWRVSDDPNFTSLSQYVVDGITCNKNAGWAVDFGCRTYDAHYLVGNYYQWLAATAQTEADGVSVGVGVPVETSICPTNWQLPSSGAVNNDRRDSFYNLLKHYGNLTDGVTLPMNSTATVNIAKTPLFLSRTGYVDLGFQRFENIGAAGHYWSSTASSIKLGFDLHFNSSSISFSNSNGRADGFPVRCLVLSPEE